MGITLVHIERLVKRQVNQVIAGLFSCNCTGDRLDAERFDYVRKKVQVQGGVTRRELAESRQNARHYWFRAPRHYSASLLVVTRRFATYCQRTTRPPGRLIVTTTSERPSKPAVRGNCLSPERQFLRTMETLGQIRAANLHPWPYLLFDNLPADLTSESGLGQPD